MMACGDMIEGETTLANPTEVEANCAKRRPTTLVYEFVGGGQDRCAKHRRSFPRYLEGVFIGQGEARVGKLAKAGDIEPDSIFGGEVIACPYAVGGFRLGS